MSETQFFYTLTPDIILDSVEQLGVRCTGRCLTLNSLENRVYEVEIELSEFSERQSAENYRIVKFYRPGRWSKAQIEEEHRFLSELNDKGVPVVPPISFPDGSTLKKVADQEIYFTVFPKAAGRMLDELNDQQLRRIGRTIARLHNIGATKAFEARIPLMVENYGFDNLNYLLSEKIVPPEMADSFKGVVEEICSITLSRYEGVPLQRIHGDCHVGNVLWRDEDCLFVDFDDAVRGPCVQDIWLLTPGRDAETDRQRTELLSGYEEFRPFNYATLNLIEPLRALRIIHFAAWIARRWEDPYFKRTFVEFGTQQFWREQLSALSELRYLMQGVEF